MYLGKISGQDIALPEPVTRVEMYLASIAGMDVVLPDEPVTRIEVYLAEWAEGSNIPWETLSGAIVSFIAPKAHALKQVVVDVNPVQDLHGYDYPWPPGGGKNILDPDKRTETTQNLYYYLSDGIVLKAGTYTVSISGGNAAGIYINKKADASTLAVKYNATELTFTLAEDTGVYVNIYYSPAPPDMASVKCQLETGSMATAWTPYSNICPISGWNGCEVYRTGINVWDEEWELGEYNAQLSTVEKYEDNTHIRSKNPIPVKPNTTYYMNSAGNNVHLIVADADGNVLYRTITLNSGTFTTPVNGVFVYFNMASAYGTTYNHDISINYPGTDTGYHAYTGNSYVFSFGETVYKGNLDVTTGLLTATWGAVVLNGSENWHNPDGSGFPYLDFNSLKKSLGYGNIIISDKLSAVGGSYQLTQKRYAVAGFIDSPNSYPGANWLYINADGRRTVAELKEWLTNNPTEVCYELANPITIQLTPQQVAALKGYNAMWSNGGDIEVTVHGTPVEVETLQALNMLLGGAYHNEQTADDVSDDEALDILLGGDNK